jgi:hypothetical protein
MGCQKKDKVYEKIEDKDTQKKDASENYWLKNNQGKEPGLLVSVPIPVRGVTSINAP